ncbi:MAG: hypothetical protein V1779_07955 [bacterium]
MKNFKITNYIFFAFCCLLFLVSCDNDEPSEKLNKYYKDMENRYYPLKDISFEMASFQLNWVLLHLQIAEICPKDCKISCYTNKQKERFLKSYYTGKLYKQMMNNRYFLESILTLKKASIDSLNDLIFKLRNYRTYVSADENKSGDKRITTEAGCHVELKIDSIFSQIIIDFIKLDEKRIRSIWRKE